ncbi:protein of unknown function [Moritella yayanosii]|uniref:Uncharacterized protein n=1 Tax=Moritella yayanosii TaxID=69539 RepID=A0A330LUS0_9GAMM|nr:protein of unknown function [Moritella yayanosii]
MKILKINPSHPMGTTRYIAYNLTILAVPVLKHLIAGIKKATIRSLSAITIKS